jgi:hypothetical protein
MRNFVKFLCIGSLRKNIHNLEITYLKVTPHQNIQILKLYRFGLAHVFGTKSRIFINVPQECNNVNLRVYGLILLIFQIDMKGIVD